MSTCTSGAEADPDTNLVSGHAYTLLSVVDIESEGEPVILIKIRNTWGSKEWSGDWSDDSDLWTDDLKEEIGLVEANDGIFFISADDFKKNFYQTIICYYEDDYVKLGH
jgi:calpain-15